MDDAYFKQFQDTYNERSKQFEARIDKDKYLKEFDPERYKFFNRYIKDGDKVLDAGCQSGLFMKWLTDLKKVKVYGVDISDHAIEGAKKYLDGNKQVAGFKHALIEEIPYDDDQFDVTICSEVLEHTKEPIVVLKELTRVTKPNGYIVCSFPIGKNLMCDQHLHFFNYYSVMDLYDQIGSDYRIYQWHKVFKKTNYDIYIIVMRKGTPIDDNDNENLWEDEKNE